MESVLALLCIIFFAVLTYGFIQGVNINRRHLHNCRNIYVPEDIDLETAFNSLKNKSIDGLKKRARELGASKKYIDDLSSRDDTSEDVEKTLKTTLIKYIVLNSVSDEHISFESIEDKINDGINVPSEDKIKLRRRITQEVNSMDRPYDNDFLYDLNIYEPSPSPGIVIDQMVEKMNFDKNMVNQSLQELREELDMD